MHTDQHNRWGLGVSEAGGQKLEEGERNWVSQRFVLTLIYLTVTFIERIHYYSFTKKWVRNVMLVLDNVYF